MAASCRPANRRRHRGAGNTFRLGVRWPGKVGGSPSHRGFRQRRLRAAHAIIGDRINRDLDSRSNYCRALRRIRGRRRQSSGAAFGTGPQLCSTSPPDPLLAKGRTVAEDGAAALQTLPLCWRGMFCDC